MSSPATDTRFFYNAQSKQTRNYHQIVLIWLAGDLVLANQWLVHNRGLPWSRLHGQLQTIYTDYGSWHATELGLAGDSRMVHRKLTVAVQITEHGESICTMKTYRQFSNISRTQSPNINVSCLILRLSLPNPLKSRVKLRMKMLEQRRQAMLQLHLSDQQFYCLLRCILSWQMMTLMG